MLKRTQKGQRNITIDWAEAQTAQTACKTQLVDAAFLTHPNTEAHLTLFTDASDTAVGASLNQYKKLNNETSFEPIAFFSAKLSPSQQEWDAYDRE